MITDSRTSRIEKDKKKKKDKTVLASFDCPHLFSKYWNFVGAGIV